MTDQEFKLRLDIPKEFPKAWKRRYSYYCHNSDGMDNCECMSVHSKAQEDCVFFGRPIEPLAFYLPPFSNVKQQKQSPFYGVVPKEIRDLIFEYALADDGVPAPNSENAWRRGHGARADVAQVDIACALLQTCKAVYLETYRLPMLLNGYLSYRDSGPWRPDMARLAPWQYALIQRIDLSVQQVALEQGDLQSELNAFHAILRHSGAYVAPHFYSISRHTYRTDGVIASHNFGLTTSGEDVEGWHPEDGEKVTLPNACQSRYYDEEIGHYYLQTHENFTARAMVARPLTHLTIRMSRTDWWTWTDDPNTKDIEEQLALDPAYGVTSRPLLTDMLSLAAQRREGQHPVYNDSWGTAIGNLPDLKTFELILETFMEKRSQLEVLVDCAQTWKFPLRDTQYELACDGRVVDLRWAKAAAEEGGWETEAENESEEMDFDGDTSSPKHSRDEAAGKEAANDDEDMQDVEDGETDGERKHGVIDEDEAMADTSPSILLSSMRYNQGLRLDTTVCGPGPSRVGSQANQIVTPVGPSFSPLVPHNYPEHDSGLNSAGYTGIPDSYPNSPTSPAYSPASSSSDGYNPISPRYSPTSPIWTERSTEFEVRVIHFRRRRID